MNNNQLELPFDLDKKLANMPNTDPIIDDTTKHKTYIKTATAEERKQINISNLNSKKNELTYFNNKSTPLEDNSKRLITDIRPVDQMINFIPKATAQIINGIKIIAPTKEIANSYMNNGSQSKDILQTEEDKIRAKNICEKWKWSSYKSVIADLAGSLLKQISTGVTFQGIKAQYVEAPNGDKIITSWLVRLTYPQLKKCAFGGLVDKYGDINYGYADILAHTTEKDLQRFIIGKDPEPRLLYFAKNQQVFGEYAPIRIIDRKYDYLTIELDRRYFPFDFTDTGDPIGIQKGNRYIANIAGLSSILEIGRNKLYNKYKDTNDIENAKYLPTATVANRFYQTLMGAFQYQSMLGIHVTNTHTDKENIVLRRNGIENMLGNTEITIKKEATADLFPKEASKRQWGDIQKKGKLIGDIFIEGLKDTGLDKELKSDPNASKILIPSNVTGMQYLYMYKNALLAKVEPINKLT